MDVRSRIDKGLSGRTRTLFLGETPVPANNGYVTLLDTTRKTPVALTALPPISAALPTIGGEAGGALGRIFTVLVSCTSQNVTALQYVKHGDATWKLFSTTTITAGADPQSFTWDPSGLNGAEDALFVVLAGGTAPSHVYASVTERTIA